MTTTNDLYDEQHFADEFWARCLVIMKNKNLTQQGLSETLGWNKRRIETLVSGHRTPSLIELSSFAKELNTSVEYLITGKEPEIKDRSSEVIEAVEKALQQFK